MSTKTISTNNATFVSNGPLTTAVTDSVAPGMLLNEIDRRVTKIRPMATPIDQISRLAGARRSGSMKVDYYSVDTKPATTTLAEEPAAGGKIGDIDTFVLTVRDPIFEESETIMVQGVKVKKQEYEGSAMILYVLSVDDTTGKLTVTAVNADAAEVANLNGDEKLIRMGRAATELDVQTAQFSALPKKAQNFCQIFKMQVEESTYQKIANKEVGWSFSDQEEAAIMDMRLGMEKNFLFGRKNMIFNPRKKENVMFTEGIWYQCGKEYRYPARPTNDTMIDMMQEAFTGNGGSSRKILIAGSNLVSQLNKLKLDRVVTDRNTVTRWGIDFDELHSKFGTLLVRHSEVFDACGHSYDGIIIDPEYLTKYSHVPFSTERLDLRKSGQRNTDAVVVTEASCLVLRYPDAHVRVWGHQSV
ncbi:MAG: DUF5309 family protein [Candidatus Amulumruptor caecigallinarius]|nr:DUF5309 family protein [Candidatus Amulumruptor caecigallinarius]MCM1396995.1 DUF5309 family protein [Candidatus Amulumruptor caecigallinarius]MCM1454647.1 DUF5309 family protein [bacterium]